MLDADAVVVTLRDETGALVEEARGARGPLAPQAEAARRGDAAPPAPGVAVAHVGAVGVRGVVCAASTRAGFPTAHDRLLVTLAANEADTALRAGALDRQIATAQAQIARMEKLSALGQLVGGVAHEVRTPLAHAFNTLHLARSRLQAAEPTPERVAAAVDLIAEAEGAMTRIVRIVDDLRRFATPGPGRVAEFDLADVAREALRLFHATHPGGLRVDVDLAPCPPAAADRVQVQQILLNLLQNAADAAGPDGRARVLTRSADGAAELVVEDDGPGMPREVRERVFDPFFTTKPTGMGLGLAIVRRIVEAHRATVRLESEVGRGTRFSIRFPPVAPVAADRAEAAETGVARAG